MHWTYCDIAVFSPEELQQAYASLSPSRMEHIDRLRRQEDKNRSLAGEILAQKLLKEQYAISTAVIHRHNSGQPYLTGCNLHISISHCDELVACAVSEDPVGIDIERIRPINPQLCQRVCTEAEMAYLQPGNFEDPNILRRFFEIWTAKEAYFKKRGTGITNLKSVNILELPRQTHFIKDFVLQII